MKKKLALSALLIAGCVTPAYGWNPFSASSWEDLGRSIAGGFEKAGKAIATGATQAYEYGIKPIGEAIIDAAEWVGQQALAGVKKVLKIGGVDLDQILFGINQLQGAIPKITNNLDAINKTVNADTGPLKKGQAIAKDLEGLIEQAKSVAGGSVIDSVTKATGLMNQIPGAINKVTSKINTMNTGIILDHARDAINGISDVLKAVVYIRGSLSGAIEGLAEKFLTEESTNALMNLSRDFYSLARNINGMRGITAKIDLSAMINGLLVGALMNMGETIDLVTNHILPKIDVFKGLVSGFEPNINGIQQHIDSIMTAANGIQSRIENRLKKPENIAICVGTVGIGCAVMAIQTLGDSLKDIKRDLRGILFKANDIMLSVAKMLGEGGNLLGQFKAKINVDILPPSPNPRNPYIFINKFIDLGNTLENIGKDLNDVADGITVEGLIN